MGLAFGSEDTEVAAWRAVAAGAERGMAVGAAAGVAAHGPVAAAGHLAGELVRVSGHDGLLSTLL